MKGRQFQSREWLDPRLICEIIARSELLVASSLHASITALSYGVAVARVVECIDPKFEAIDGFESVARIDDKEALSRIAGRRRQIESRVVEYGERLERHWDDVATAVLHPSVEASRRSRRLMSDMVVELCSDAGRVGAVVRWTALAQNFAARARRKLAHAASRARRSAGAQRRAPAPEGPLQASKPVLNVERLNGYRMETEPYRWGLIDRLFSPEDAEMLAASFPRDRFRKVVGNDGEKSYHYFARSLIHMGASTVSHSEALSPAWQALAADLLSDGYREALSRTTGLDLSSALMEVNVVCYGPGSWLGPHVDLKEKVATHILYFNDAWDGQAGGCLNILQSRDPADTVAAISPLVGNSALLVRSDHSWHSVSPVATNCARSRRSLNVIFHLKGSISTMWPPGKRHALRPAPNA